MQSSDLIPELQRLPPSNSESHTYREMIEDLIRMDPVSEAMEISIATYIGMWGIFDRVNVDDETRAKLLRAYEGQYPGTAEEYSLHERFTVMQERSP